MKSLVFFLAAVLCFAAAAGAVEQNYYLYQQGQIGAPGDLTLEAESAYGTRETRLLGEDVFEQSLRARVAGTSWLSIEAWGGIVSTEERTATETEETGAAEETKTDVRNTAFSGDLYGRLLRQDKHAIDLTLGLGYKSDYERTSIPRARVTAAHEFRDWNVSGSVLAEMPLEEKEETEKKAGEDEVREFDAGTEEEPEEGPAYDEVDILVSLASSYRMTDWFRLGAEAALEDMEGFWEDEEAEGGAKTILGPTTAFTFWERTSVRMNLAAVLPVTSNPQTRVPGGAMRSGPGFLGRLAVGYTF